jgi:WD40-like Beta Propeller Repeat
MTADVSFDRILQGWLEAEAPATTPIGLHERAIDRAKRARQRSRWLVVLRGGTFETTRRMQRARLGTAYLLLALAVVLALIAAAVAVGAIHVDPFERPVGANGAIAYSVLDSDIGSQIHLMRADGTNNVAIGTGRCPAFSGDGNALAYIAGLEPGLSQGNAQLTVARADGSSPHVVPDIGYSVYSLSPDGARVAWFKPLASATIGSELELWVTPVLGGTEQRLVPAMDQPSLPVWSPDGTHIAFAGRLNVEPGLGSSPAAVYVVDADGTNLRKVSSRPGISSVGMAWSPDGRYLAYLALPDGVALPSIPATGASPDSGLTPTGVFVIGVDGSGDRGVTMAASDFGQLAWSPDGSHLAVEAFNDTGRHVTTVAMSGPDPVGPVVQGPSAIAFRWSPDGTRLVLLDQVESQPASGPAITSSVVTVDPEFRQPPTTVLQIDFQIDCPPSWQRLEFH